MGSHKNLLRVAYKMKPAKSERLRKLESELRDLEQWLQLGLVPKKDIDRHQEEIQCLKEKIDEEKERLQFLKEGGEAEEFIVPKRNAAKPGYNEVPTVPDIDIADTNAGLSDAGFEMETYITEDTSTISETEGDTFHSQEGTTSIGDVNEPFIDEGDDDEEDESYFSDKNRWRRGGIIDPDADDW
jgi:hypothetical protein